GRTGAPAVPRDCPRRGATDPIPAGARRAIVAPGTSVQRVVVRRAAALRPGPPVAGASRARGFRAAAGSAPAEGGPARLRRTDFGAVQAPRIDAAVLSALDRKPARPAQHRNLAGARQARRRATGEALCR